MINDATTELQRRLGVACRDHNASNSPAWNTPMEETLRAQMRTTIARELFAETYGRPPSDERELTGFIATQSRDQTTSTAGYDLTFSPVKSFSVLWALAPNDLGKILEECHERAVADTWSGCRTMPRSPGWAPKASPKSMWTGSSQPNSPTVTAAR